MLYICAQVTILRLAQVWNHRLKGSYVSVPARNVCGYSIYILHWCCAKCTVCTQLYLYTYMYSYPWSMLWPRYQYQVNIYLNMPVIYRAIFVPDLCIVLYTTSNTNSEVISIIFILVIFASHIQCVPILCRTVFHQSLCAERMCSTAYRQSMLPVQ